MLRSLRVLLLMLATALSSQILSPISLQDTSGQSLDFVSLSVRPVIYGPFAFVENEMIFQNPEFRQMEGRFTLALPSGASPSRLAMEIFGKLMEGEVLDKLKARKVYRSFLHVARDPALLEQSQGNLFSVRIFPIRPRSLVRLVLSYTLLLPLKDGVRKMTLPLRGLPQIKDFSFSALVSDPTVASSDLQFSCVLPRPAGSAQAVPDTVHTDAFRFQTTMSEITPDQDIVLNIVVPAAPSVTSSGIGLAPSDTQLVSLFRIGSSSTNMTAEFLPPVWRIYIDTSASTADTFVVRKAVIEALIDASPDAAEIEVFGFDVQVTPLLGKQRAAQGLGASVRQAIERRLPLGGTNLEALIDHINAIQPTGASVGVILLTDAIPTVLTRESAVLGRRLKPHSSVVVQVGVIGTKYSEPVGNAMAAYGGGRVVHIPLVGSFLDLVSRQAWQKFSRAIGRRAQPQLTSGSAAWVWPESFFDLRPGDEAIVFSGVDSQKLAATGGLSSTSLTSALNVDGDVVSLPSNPIQVESAFKELVVREVVRSQLSLLESRRALAETAVEELTTRDEIVALSVAHRVLCPHTALLVLESEADYRNFNIPRDALRPILIIGNGGVELQSRTDFFRHLPTPSLTPSDFPAPAPSPTNADATQPTLAPTLPEWCDTPCDVGNGSCKKLVFNLVNCPELDDNGACPDPSVLCGSDNGTGAVDPTQAPSSAPTVVPTVSELCSLSCQVGAGQCRVEAFGTLNCASVKPSGTCPEVPEIGPIAFCPAPGEDTTIDVNDTDSELADEEDDEESSDTRQGGQQSGAVANAAIPRCGAPLLHEWFVLPVLLLSQSLFGGAQSCSMDVPRRRNGDVSELRHAWLRWRTPLVCAAASLAALALTGCEGDNCDECGDGRHPGQYKTTWEATNPSVQTKPDQRKRADSAKYALYLWRMNRTSELLEFASSWMFWDPANTLAYEYIGKAAAAEGDDELAIRATTSIIEIAPRDSEQLLRGAWIMMSLPEGMPAVGDVTPAGWAEKFANRSLAERKDNPNTYRALAQAAWKADNLPAAAHAYKQGFSAPITSGRYGDWRKALEEEASLFLKSVESENGAGVAAQLREQIGWSVARADSLDQLNKLILARFTLSWLSDATTVDLHVIGPDGQECYWANSGTSVGLYYYQDVFPEGLGPQVIVLRPEDRRGSAHKGTYQIGVKYYAVGSMGAARGVITMWQLDPVSGLLNKSRIEPFTLPTKQREVLRVGTFVVD